MVARKVLWLGMTAVLLLTPDASGAWATSVLPGPVGDLSPDTIGVSSMAATPSPFSVDVTSPSPVAAGGWAVVALAEVDALIYGTFIGGFDFDDAKALAVDDTGAVYVTGYAGAGLPTTPGAFQTIYTGGLKDAFVAKLTPDGTDVVWVTYLGGTGKETGMGIDIAADGSVVVVGDTTSVDFPTVGAFQPAIASGTDAFVARLSADGTSLVYASYLGGGSWDSAMDVVVDDQGYAYVAGTTRSFWTDFPTTPGAYASPSGGHQDVFVTKVSPDGSSLVYSTCFGGTGWDWAHGLAVDAAGAAYVTGEAYDGYGFPTTPGAFRTSTGGGRRNAPFVVKLLPDGSDLAYATYVAGSTPYSSASTYLGVGEDIAVRSDGVAYVVGVNGAMDSPTTPGAYIGSADNMKIDVFVTLLNADGSDVLYSGLVGGNGFDVGKGVALDSQGMAYVTGHTASPDFPTTIGALQRERQALTVSYFDGFFFVLNPAGNGIQDLVYSTFLGGAEDDQMHDVTFHAQSGSATIAGTTTSENMPVTSTAYDISYGGGVFGDEPYGDGYVARLQPRMPWVASVTPCTPGPYYFWSASADFANWDNVYAVEVDWRGYTPDHLEVVGSDGAVETFALSGAHWMYRSTWVRRCSTA